MHLQACKRRAQLMRRVGQKSLLYFVRLAELLEHPVQRFDRGHDLGGRRRFVERLQIMRRAAQQLRAHRGERCDAAHDPIDEVLHAPDAKKAKEVEVKIVHRLQRHIGDPRFVALGEKLEQLRALENGIQIAVAKVDYDSIGVDVPEDVGRVEKILRSLNR